MSGPRNTAEWTAMLLEQGYCIIPDLLPAELIVELDADLDPVFAQTPFGHGDFYGFRTKRFGRLPCRSPLAERLILEPTVLGLARAMLESACERIQLNVAQAIEVHPGEIEQFPHCDEDMWQGAKGTHEYLLNVMWPLNDFCAENGATRIYPGTHRNRPSSLDDLPEAIAASCRPGSAICFLGSTVHGAGPNRSTLPRRGVVIGYSLGWLKPYENSWLAYPPEIARQFTAELAELAGYALHKPNLGNFEGQCPSLLLREDIPANPQAIDALRPEQEVAVAFFAELARNAS